MEKGTLRDYIRAHELIDRSQRHQWILTLTKGLQLLHHCNIIHADFGPTNFLLDDSLKVKISDFACCSMDGCKATGCAGFRFNPCYREWRKPVTINEDLFALGSTIYEILSGNSPLADVPSDQVRVLHELCQFADLSGLEMADIIRDCWLGAAGSAQAVYERVLAAVGV
jgi:serine/threonine protein kinase